VAQPDEDPGAGTRPAAGKAVDWNKRAQKAQFIGALAIPISIIALIASLWQFNEQQKTDSRQAVAQQKASEAAQLDQQRQTTLNNYLNEMSNLALNYNLSHSKRGSPVNALAVAQTDTAVRYLDRARKGELVRYLWEASLITGRRPVMYLYEINLNRADFMNANLARVNLSTDHLAEADFSGANSYGAYLTGADLIRANLSGADLSCFRSSRPGISAGILGILNPGNIACTGAPAGANLVNADLRDADLRGANLVGADLAGADLQGADLRGATYNSKPMPLAADLQGKTLAVEATQWPKGFNPVAAGAICVAYC
jgi:uncharacterized protein YjbI with pentapeptide repeats